MAQTIVTLCDLCLEADDGAETPPGASSYTIKVTGAGESLGFNVDLCSVHGSEMAGVWKALAHVGRPLPGARLTRRGRARPDPATGTVELPPDESAYPCPECGRSYAYRGGLGSHWRDKHVKETGRSLAQALKEDTPYVCEECGQAFTKIQGLAVHQTRKKHGAAA